MMIPFIVKYALLHMALAALLHIPLSCASLDLHKITSFYQRSAFSYNMFIYRKAYDDNFGYIQDEILSLNTKKKKPWICFFCFQISQQQDSSLSFDHNSFWTTSTKNFYHPNQLSIVLILDQLCISVSQFRHAGLTSL